jgi:hypothetical protein
VARPKTHKDVEFQVAPASDHSHRVSKSFKTFTEAASEAVATSVMHGEPVVIDVIVWSPSGARWYGGDDAVALYKDDPETSVFERIVVKADGQGRIP